MSTSPTERRKSRNSLFGLTTRTPSSLSPLTTTSTASRSSERLNSIFLRKKSPISRASSPFGTLASPQDEPSLRTPPSEGAQLSHSAGSSSLNLPEQKTSSVAASQKTSNGARLSSGKKGNRPSSVFGSLKSLRFNQEDDTPPSTANSTAVKSASSTWKDFGAREELTDIGRNRTVLYHGEVQTSSGWLFKKKEYLVLTETHLIRYKNFIKATENFPSLTVRRNNIYHHSSSQSIDSNADSLSQTSDTSGEKANAVPLDQVVAVYLDDGRPLQSLEISYLDTENGQGSSLTLGLVDADERDSWLQNLRTAANRARLLDQEPISQGLAEYAARVVEREEDYDVCNFKIYKVVKNSSQSSGRSSADDSSKANTTICLFVIGAHKVHFIQLPRSALRGSTPSLADLGGGYNHGILTVTWISVSDRDDTFCLTFRFPFKRPRAYQLYSLAAVEISRQLRQRDRALRPEWTTRTFQYNAPSPFEDDGPRSNRGKELGGWTDSLTAFCVSYNVSPSIVRYAVEYDVEDAPQFILYPPDRPINPFYTVLELLAIMRSLRFNETFRSIYFAANLDNLNERYDPHGAEFASHFQKNGRPVGLTIDEQENSSILVSEVRAIATSNPKLRRIDFSGSIAENCLSSADPGRAPRGSGAIEAMYPICRKQSTNVDWFGFSYIPLTELDIEYLTALASEKACHVRGIELSGCGLTDQNLDLVIDIFKAQSNTLEAIDVSRNPVKLNPEFLARSLEPFNFIRRLDLSNLGLNGAPVPILGLDTLERWRLEDLRLSGTQLNDESVHDLCKYLGHRQSEVLKSLYLNDCGLTGARVADLMEAMTWHPTESRLLAFDVSDNRLTSNHDRLVAAIARGLAPTHLSMRALEYDADDDKFAEMLFALAGNRSIRALDIARISLAADASPTATVALEELFRSNTTIIELDISGEKSRLEHAHLGKGILKALKALTTNVRLEVLRIQHQKLGLQGASVLSEVVEVNSTLREIHCQYNDISLSGFTDLVNALANNHTLLYLPPLAEGRENQLRSTEGQIRAARMRSDGTPMNNSNRMSSMRRTFARMSQVNPITSSTPAVPEWTQQDIQAALRLVTESWEGQVERLNGFLDRNARVASGIPIGQDEDPNVEPQRPGTAGSMTNILKKVSMDRTPREEKQIELGVAQATETPLLFGSVGGPRKGSVSSKSLPKLPSPIAATSAGLAHHKFSTPRPISRASTLSPKVQGIDDDPTPVFEKLNPFDVVTKTDYFRVVGEETIRASQQLDIESFGPSTLVAVDQVGRGGEWPGHDHNDENAPRPGPPKY